MTVSIILKTLDGEIMELKGESLEQIAREQGIPLESLSTVSTTNRKKLSSEEVEVMALRHMAVQTLQEEQGGASYEENPTWSELGQRLDDKGWDPKMVEATLKVPRAPATCFSDVSSWCHCRV